VSIIDWNAFMALVGEVDDSAVVNVRDVEAEPPVVVVPPAQSRLF
jgi:hypothetical protein